MYTDDEIMHIFDKLYDKNTSSPHMIKEISKKQRLLLQLTSPSLTSGETSCITFNNLFHKLYLYGLHKDDGGTFIDLGCSCGKLVYLAALYHNFDACIGIEILSDLYTIGSSDVKGKWKKTMMADNNVTKQNIDLKFFLGDFLYIDWSYGNVIYINSTCFNSKMMNSIAYKAEELVIGSLVITISKPLPSSLLNVVETGSIEMDWGICTYYIHIRIEGKRFNELNNNDFVQALLLE